ncbi:NAD-dependent epimerase/dehydratase family protein [Microbacterium sp. M1A1_1b]
MADVLILGGTGWLGRHIAAQSLADGDDVTCLARGTSGAVPDGARLVRADRRDPDAYDRVRRPWDRVVEIASDPGLVAGALDALADHAGHWTLVSTISVSADDDRPGADESAPLVEPSDLSQYADAKVAAERATAERLGDRLLIARPGLIVGPGDPSDRFGYWPARLSQPGPVLIPTPTDRFVQTVDVRDLAAWIARTDATGPVNVVGDAVPMDAFFREAVAVAGFTGELLPLEDEALFEHDVRYWAGPRSLPLWLPRSASGFARRSNSAFRQSGGTTRPLRTTLRDVLTDEQARGVTRPRRSGLTLAEEAAVLAAR